MAPREVLADGHVGVTGDAAGRGWLSVQSLGFAVSDRRQLLSDVSFRAGPGSLTAIIGPSGAGKSTLAKLIGGVLAPTAGVVEFEGHDVHAEYAALRSRIGMVPQDDVVHHQLTLEQALRYAAELRLAQASKDDRHRAVQNVLCELELAEHARTRVADLSGGQRKRASVAMELLTEPSLLILDEPTSGLDPALDRHIMSTLRRLADAGRVVLVVTHCLTYLDVCDQVLFLTPRGKVAYCGAPADIAGAMGADDWADIFADVGADPEAAHRRFLARCRKGGGDAPPPPSAPSPVRQPRRARLAQLSTVARRQLRLIVADRGYFIFLAVLPYLLGVLTLVVPGEEGFGLADARGPAPNEPAQIVMMLNISAVFMGMALTIRDLVGERSIFRREQAVGLSASAYLVAKATVYCVIAAAQTATLTAIVLAGKGGPTRGAVLLGHPALELYVTLAVTAAVAAMMGLALSALVKSQEQILPTLVISVMLSIVFSGGLIPVTGRMVLDQLSWLVPARWGFAASAATTDLRHVAPLSPANETLWTHEPRWWLLNMAMLAVLAAIMAAITRWRLRLNVWCGTPVRTPRHRRVEYLAAEQNRRRSADTPSAPTDIISVWTSEPSDSPRCAELVGLGSGIDHDLASERRYGQIA
ncbi:ABC transporter ATP-binding protein/permease [Mycolicibacterium thermoresistibile]